MRNNNIVQMVIAHLESRSKVQCLSHPGPTKNGLNRSSKKKKASAVKGKRVMTMKIRRKEEGKDQGQVCSTLNQFLRPQHPTLCHVHHGTGPGHAGQLCS